MGAAVGFFSFLLLLPLLLHLLLLSTGEGRCCYSTLLRETIPSPNMSGLTGTINWFRRISQFKFQLSLKAEKWLYSDVFI